MTTKNMKKMILILGLTGLVMTGCKKEEQLKCDDEPRNKTWRIIECKWEPSVPSNLADSVRIIENQYNYDPYLEEYYYHKYSRVYSAKWENYFYTKVYVSVDTPQVDKTYRDVYPRLKFIKLN